MTYKEKTITYGLLLIINSFIIGPIAAFTDGAAASFVWVGTVLLGGCLGGYVGVCLRRWLDGEDELRRDRANR